MIVSRGCEDCRAAKLLPTAEQAVALRSTLHNCNAGAGRAAEVASAKREFPKFGLQKLVYTDLRAAGLGAQAAIRTIKKVSDAYTTLRANISPETWESRA
ncbi:hypothetical protein ACIP98_41485 [Streptomyces sp. NPDC088354]|uniref:hypothetical protein n=1 Tax=Streptomyces sp. NPDC088354 TaxID=3365856 RepID=UPI00380581A5